MQFCYFCRREKAERKCETCKRWVCIQCGDSHNCYPREDRDPEGDRYDS